MTIHDLKSWPQYFEPIVDGEKPFEIRRNDRGYAVGDLLHLREWDPLAKEYTGQQLVQRVTYLLSGFEGITDGYVVLGLDKMPIPRSSWHRLPLKLRERFWAETGYGQRAPNLVLAIAMCEALERTP